MKKYLISLLAVGAIALTAVAGDLRQPIVIPAGVLATTNACFLSMPVRGNATAHIDGFAIGACATATNLTIADVLVGVGYTNTITVYNAAITASAVTQLTPKLCVGTLDTFVVTLNATNSVATYVYINMQGY